MNNDSSDTASVALLAWEIENNEKIVKHLADNPEMLALVRAADAMCDGQMSQKIAQADAIICRRAIDGVVK